jgi:hypothetical protein
MLLDLLSQSVDCLLSFVEDRQHKSIAGVLLINLKNEGLAHLLQSFLTIGVESPYEVLPSAVGRLHFLFNFILFYLHLLQELLGYFNVLVFFEGLDVSVEEEIGICAEGRVAVHAIGSHFCAADIGDCGVVEFEPVDPIRDVGEVVASVGPSRVN